jgi:hypothetical protein
MQFTVATKSMFVIPLFGLLGACGGQSAPPGGDPNSQSPARAKKQCLDGTTVAWNKTCPTPPPVVAPPPAPAPVPVAIYDTSIGTGVDENGFAMLPLRAGARRYYVSSVAGADGNGCLNAVQPTKPLRTIAAAISCVQDGSGDQVLLAEGTRYAEALPWLAFKGGNSAQYPTVIQSYDPADPTNEAKYGRGDQRSARPVLTAPQAQAGNGIYSFIAIRGLDFNPGNISGPSLALIGQSNYILIENNIFRFTGVTFDNGDKTPSTRHILRHNSLYGQWSTGGRTGGLYDAGTDGVTVEDNVFWHNGWRVGGSRDAPIAEGGATVFSHAFYLQTNTTAAVVRRNLTMDGAGDGGIARGDILFTENVSIDNPACVGLGGGPTYNTERPNGVKIEASYNACFGDADVNSSHTLGWGINTTNGVAGSKVHHNLLVRTRNSKGPSVTGFSNNATFDQPSYAAFEHNLLYQWAASGQTYWTQTGGFVGQVRTSYNFNRWGDPALGTNVNSDSMTFPMAYTGPQLFVALGCNDKATCAARMVETPEFAWGANAQALLFTGYGLK